jgi:desampylase
MLTFAFEALGAIVEQVRKAEDEEVGGLLAADGELVKWASPVTNQSVSPRREFWIDPKQLGWALGLIEEHGLELAGSYHSHPSGNAQMSGADVAMAASTGLLLIVAPMSWQWRWRLWDPVAGGEVDFAVAPPYATPYRVARS